MKVIVIELLCIAAISCPIRGTKLNRMIHLGLMYDYVRCLKFTLKPRYFLSLRHLYAVVKDVRANCFLRILTAYEIHTTRLASSARAKL